VPLPSPLPERRPLNGVNLIGRLAGDPRRRRSGPARTTVRVAVPRRAGDVRQGELYVDVVTYGEQAEAVAGLRRGRLVAVTGRLEQRQAEVGNTRSPYFIVASEVDFLEGR
jgi:single-stranded DNA-binding protein